MKKKKYSYACMELNLELKNDMVAQVKIPFEHKRDAWKYLSSHFDGTFHSKYWVE